MKQPRVAVIGAGWAGLAAAAALVPKAKVSLFEAGKQAGGRARALNQADAVFARADNGQHILLGAYHSVLQLLRQVGVDEADVFMRLPMRWHMVDGMRLRTPKLPAPWHLLVGMWRADGLSGAEKWRALRGARALVAWTKQPLAEDISVAEWLRRMQMPGRLVAEFWQPLVWAALNTPLTVASVRTLATVLQEGVLAKRSDSDYLLPKRDLQQAFVAPVLQWLQQNGVQWQPQQRIQHIAPQADGSVAVDGRLFDAVIIATAPYHVLSLLPPPLAQPLKPALDALAYSAITTVYLRYAEAFSLPEPMVGFVNGTVQWLVDRQRLGLGKQELAAVISVAQQHDWSRDEWIEAVHRDVLRLCPYLGAPQAALVVSEKRATFQAAVGRTPPPSAHLQRHRIYLAGDYTHPRYPATLEGAVQSGQRAAADCLTDWI